MLICGIKATHDAGVALIQDGALLASIEVEKLNNGRRYSPLARLDAVDEIVRAAGVDPAAVDRFVIDGWHPTPGGTSATVQLAEGADPAVLPVAPYVEGADGDPLARYEFGPVNFGGGLVSGYSSYHHATNHVLGCYCTSPFAARGEDAVVVIWDGGMLPTAYQVSVRGGRTVRALGPLLPVHGYVFADFCRQFGPFDRARPEDDHAPDAVERYLEVAGKAMAYAGLGTATGAVYARFAELFADWPSNNPGHDGFELAQKIRANQDQFFPGGTDADIIAGIQDYLGRALLRATTDLVRTHFGGVLPNLCLGGGCALNIKWNTRLRESGVFKEVWIPPFPNDSGAAIGTACCEMFVRDERHVLEWDTFRGPTLAPCDPPRGWTAEPCDERRLAEILHRTGEPVVVLSQRAELGPRALGNRSIIAPAVDGRMKDLLNGMKGREGYRPVAPVCLAGRAREVFEPGTPDPYMLFEHRVRREWRSRVPAIVHLDGSARLQTVDESTASPIVAILTEYERLSGIPLLCNTSANLGGRGFFPDVATAARWGRTRRIWSDGTLYVDPAFTGPTLDRQ